MRKANKYTSRHLFPLRWIRSLFDTLLKIRECVRSIFSYLQQLVQNFAVRIVLGLKKFDHISQGIRSLNWLPVNDKLYLNDAIMMFKCINKLVPDYLIGKFTLRSQTHSRNTRQRGQLYLSRCRTIIGQRSFNYRGAKLWNNLRDDGKSSDSVNVFRKRLVSLLFSDKSMKL